MPSERWPNGGSRAWRGVREKILERDGHRCSWVVDEEGSTDGEFVHGKKTPPERCENTTRLEVHHSEPGPAVEAEEDVLWTTCKKHHPPPNAAWKEDAAAAAAAQAVAKLDVREIPLTDLMPAAWNANRVKREILKKIRNSVKEFGVVENFVVRPHPDFPDKYEILSGNHRYAVYKQLRIKVVPCHVVQLDDAMARVLAQTLNRTRGVDDPHKLAALMDAIHAALPKERANEFLMDMMKLPGQGDVQSRMELVMFDEKGDGGFRFKPINPVKLGTRLEACCHPRKLQKALELFAGQGQLSFWYDRIFEKVIRVDKDGDGNPDYQMHAADYLREHFAADGPFDLIDMDHEGNPWEELDALFEVLKQHPHPPFVLTCTDGIAHRLKMIRNVPTDLMKVYRWPERGADKRLYLRCPELMDHGVKTRAAEAGYVTELVAMDWKPGKRCTYGTWLVGPEEDTRNEIEIAMADPDELPEAYVAWRVQLKPQKERKPPVDVLEDKPARAPRRKPTSKET